MGCSARPPLCDIVGKGDRVSIAPRSQGQDRIWGVPSPWEGPAGVGGGPGCPQGPTSPSQGRTEPCSRPRHHPSRGRPAPPAGCPVGRGAVSPGTPQAVPRRPHAFLRSSKETRKQQYCLSPPPSLLNPFFFPPKEQELPDPPRAICSDLIKHLQYLDPPEEKELILSTKNTSGGCSPPGNPHTGPPHHW